MCIFHIGPLKCKATVTDVCTNKRYSDVVQKLLRIAELPEATVSPRQIFRQVDEGQKKTVNINCTGYVDTELDDELENNIILTWLYDDKGD